jgi:hypothetical protein
VNDEIARLAGVATRPDRLYAIRSTAAYGHHAGRLTDGRQALVTCGYPKQVCVYLFTAEGEYEGVERRTPKLDADLGSDAHVRELYDSLAREYGFVPGLIRVNRFSEPREGVSIDPLPDYLAEFVADPAGEDAEERATHLELLRQWVAEESFVLSTWNDYWLNADGKVTSS